MDSSFLKAEEIQVVFVNKIIVLVLIIKHVVSYTYGRALFVSNLLGPDGLRTGYKTRTEV